MWPAGEVYVARGGLIAASLIRALVLRVKGLKVGKTFDLKSAFELNSLPFGPTSSVAGFFVSCDTVAFRHCVLGKSWFVVVFVGPCPVRFLLCFSAGWRSAYLAGGSAFRPLRFGFVVSFVFLFCQPT